MADLTSGGDDANGHPDSATALNTSQAVLQYFWDMASYDESVRVTAARGLVKDVSEDQLKHLATLGDDDEEAPEEASPKIKQLEYHLRRCSPTMVYTLRRLARGLGSSRQAARQGYATALAGLLAAAGERCISAPGVLVLLEVCNDGPLKGGDAKDTLLGRMFGYGALLRSGLPLEPSLLAALFKGLLDFGGRKSFLRECATAVALEAAERLDEQALVGLTAPGQPLAAMLAAPPAEATPEALLLALVLWPKLPPAVVGACRLLPHGTPPPPPELFAAGAGGLSDSAAAAAAKTAAGLFSRDHLATLLPALLSTSGSHPRLHTLWQYLLPLLLPGFKPHRNNADLMSAAAEAAEPAAAPPPGGGDAAAAGGAGKKAAKAAAKAAKASAAAAKSAEGKGAVSAPLLAAFWGVVVEGGLMESGSRERRYLGFQLFSRVLPHLRPDTVPVVFSPAFTKTLAGAVKVQSNHLHASGKKLMDGLSAFLERSSSTDVGVKMAVAAALQRLGGLSARNMNTNKLTSKLLQGLDGPGLHRYLVSLMAAFLRAAPPLSPENGLKAEELEKEGEEEKGEAAEGERGVEQLASERRSQCVDQLVAALKVPSVAAEDCEAALRFLALHAFAQVQPQQKPQAKGGKPSKSSSSSSSKLAEVRQASDLLTLPLSPATRTACASRLMGLITHLSKLANGRMMEQVKQKQQQQQQKKDGAAAEPPSAKKRKTGAGAAAAAADAAAPAAPLPTGAIHQDLHATLSYIRKALAAPGVTLAAELGEAGESALSLLAAIETAALERIAALEKAPAAAGKGGGGGGGGAAASRLRSLAALAGHLQLQLLADPEGFEVDLPLSLRRVAAEGLGLEGLPEVEEVEAEGEDEEDEMEEDGKPGGGKGKPGSSGRWEDVLVDLMLAVMARPGSSSVPIAPLRDAAEGLWRQCCEGLSAEGLEDMVRVVAAGGKGEGQDAAGLFESDEEEEDEEEEEGSGSESEEEEEEEGGKQRKDHDKKSAAAAAAASRKRKKGDEEEEEDGSRSGSEDDEDEPPAAAKGKKKTKGDAKGSDEGDDDEDGEDEDMDDEAMFRMDSKLAAYFRSMVGGRAGGAAAAERAAALLDFRLRALRLLECFKSKVPNSPLLLAALVPLLRALATASRPGGQPQVAARLTAVLKGMTRGRCRVDLGVLGGLEGYRIVLKRLLYEASRCRDKEVAGLAWLAFVAAVRAGAAAAEQEPEAAEAARSSFRAALTDLLTKKKTRLQNEPVAAAFRAAPAAALPSLDLLLQHVATGRNGAVRAAAAELMAAVFKAQPEGLAAALTAHQSGGGASGSSVGGALGGALAACAAGVGLKTKLRGRAAQAAVTVGGALKRLLQGKRPAEVMGSDKINAIAKAIATVQSLGAPPKVTKQLQRLGEVLGLEPLLEKTKPDPALASKIQKAAPADAQAPAKEGGKGKEGGEAAKGGKEGAAAAGTGKGKDRGKKARKEVTAKEEEAEEEESEEEEQEEAGASSGEEGASGSGSEEPESEPEDGDDEASGSGREDSDGEEEEEEEEAGASSDEEKGGRGGGRGRKRGGAAAARGGRGGAGGGRGGGRGRGRGGRGAGRSGDGGRGGGAGGRGRGRGGKQPQSQQQQHQGGSPAKKARR